METIGHRPREGGGSYSQKKKKKERKRMYQSISLHNIALSLGKLGDNSSKRNRRG